MIKKNVPKIPSFASQAELLVSIMHCRLSGDSTKKIILSGSFSAQNPFILPIEEADADCITLENFLNILDIRINAEFVYYEEVNQLKDSLCNEFNKLYDGVVDEDSIKFIRDQRQRIINAIIDETKIEEKMIAERFYNYMMNGWDEKALNMRQFTEFACSILWKPLLTPLPIEALDQLKELISKFGKQRPDFQIEKITSQLINEIKVYLKPTIITDTDFETSDELRISLEELVKKRKICNIEVYNNATNGLVVIEFASKCIDNVTLVIPKNEFLEERRKPVYSELYLDEDIEELDVKMMFNQIHRATKALGFKVEKNINFEKLAAFLSKLEFLTCMNLNLRYNYIGEEGAKSLLVVLNELKSIATLYLNLRNNNIGDEGVKAVSVALKELKNISTLNLNLLENNIGGKGVKAVSCALENLKNISTLKLNFKLNNIGEEGAIALSTALHELKHISFLKLNLTYNNIGEEEAKAMFPGLQGLKCVSTLILIMRNNNIGNEGAKAVSAALKELKNISILSLDLSGNIIGDEGAKAVSIALKELKNIKNLTLDIEENNIEVEGAKTISKALSELNKITKLNMNLWLNNIRGEGATTMVAALKELKSILTLNLNILDNNIEEESKAMLEEFQLAHPNYRMLYQI